MSVTMTNGEHSKTWFLSSSLAKVPTVLANCDPKKRSCLSYKNFWLFLGQIGFFLDRSCASFYHWLNGIVPRQWKHTRSRIVQDILSFFDSKLASFPCKFCSKEFSTAILLLHKNSTKYSNSGSDNGGFCWKSIVPPELKYWPLFFQLNAVDAAIFPVKRR